MPPAPDAPSGHTRRPGDEGDPKSLFDGTASSLIEIYQKHKKSPFNKVRYSTQIAYTDNLRALKASIGNVRIKHISFDDISNWQDEFADDGEGGKPMKGRAAKLIAQFKRVVLFGALVLPKEAGCHDVCDIFAKMAQGRMMDSTQRRRKEYMLASQCRLLRLKAHEMDYPEIALEQAFAFELGLRPKDVIGEWIPMKWPGLSDVIRSNKKWMMGLRWEEIDANLILRHRLSKSIHGAQTVMDPEAGTLKAWDLKAHPMVIDELARLCGVPVEREKLPAKGPVIVNESSGAPWNHKHFQREWRKIATAAGIPKNIQNRDSRPGAATEADLAGAPKDKTKRMLGHARGETTEIYLREELEVQRELAKLRVAKRKP